MTPQNWPRASAARGPSGSCARQSRQGRRDEQPQPTQDVGRIPDRAAGQEERRERRADNQIGGLIREVLSGEILAREALVRQVPSLLFASFLDHPVPRFGYQTERILRDKQRTLDKLEEATAEENAALRLRVSASAKPLARSTAELGLEQPTEPPILLSPTEE